MKPKSSFRRRSKQPVLDVLQEMPAQPPGASFPIVGIGASAGGLEALEQFLGCVPTGAGIAFIIIQHLDPTRKGLMAELLQRSTSMRVIQVKDRTRVRPNCVYVIPPNRDMSILHGVLHLFAPSAKRGQRLPIDFFLRSLAQDQQEHSIGVILSGMGSDGTLGLREIKEKAGLALAQDPASAKFDSMPRSVIDAGLADIVAPVEDLPAKILAYLRRTPLLARHEAPGDEKIRGSLEKALILLRTQTGHDFSLYKRNTLYRRIERRMGIHQIDKLAGYVRYLQENSQELDLLFKELLIGVTSFFRDPLTWKQLRDVALPALIASRPAGGSLRAWVPGCSTGEEAYSLAMVFKEALEKLKPRNSFTVQIYATDLDRDAIDKARQGIFPENISADVSPERLTRFFVKEERGYRVRAEIREAIIFAPHSLILDPPFTKLDLLSCRNLLIYLTPDVQKKLFPLFHYTINPGGILVLGNAETVGTFTNLFGLVNGKSRIFRRLESRLPLEPIDFPSSFSAAVPAGHQPQPPHKAHLSLQALAERLVLHRYAPPSVLVNDQGNILYVSGRTGKYLEAAAGKANWNIFAMAREGLRYELTDAFQKTLRQGGSIALRGLRIRTDAGHQFVDVTVEKIEDAEALRGLVMIVFRDIAEPRELKAAGRAGRLPAKSHRLAGLGRELQHARAELQSMRDDIQTSQEELKSTNEEMQSTNEEMQSTNEELTTSKEEMQSLNEELQTVNNELQGKVDELSRSNNDMKNLLNSTDIATLFLDNHLKVRRFTTQAIKIIKLIPSDVGRPITDLASDLLYPELPDAAREVIRKLHVKEATISSRDGRWFTVRIMPYRTLDDRIDGVVITFSDISVAKILETELRDKQDSLENRVAAQASEISRARAQLKTERERRQTQNGKSPNPART